MDVTTTKYFANTNIFITGGTGFVGLALVEKFLRSVPDVGKVYVLIRPKKGKKIMKRLHELTKEPVSVYFFIIRNIRQVMVAV